MAVVSFNLGPNRIQQSCQAISCPGHAFPHHFQTCSFVSSARLSAVDDANVGNALSQRKTFITPATEVIGIVQLYFWVSGGLRSRVHRQDAKSEELPAALLPAALPIIALDLFARRGRRVVNGPVMAASFRADSQDRLRALLPSREYLPTCDALSSRQC